MGKEEHDWTREYLDIIRLQGERGGAWTEGREENTLCSRPPLFGWWVGENRGVGRQAGVPKLAPNNE
jgi:hypothetical protein